MWPEVDENAVVEELVEIAVQVNGKVRGTVEISPDESEEKAREMVLSDEKLSEFVSEGEIKKFVYVPGKIISVVI